MNSKTRFSKKVLSVVLSVLMVVTMLPTFALTSSAADAILFHYTFDNGTADSVDSNYSFSIRNSWGAQNDDTDHYHFTDGWISSLTNNRIRSTTNDANKNWRMDFQFKFNNINSNSNNLTNGTCYLLGLSSYTEVSNDNTAFFGVTQNGNLNTTNHSAVGTATYTFNTNDTYTLTYIYHSGTFTAMINGTLLHSYEATSAEQTLLESINCLSIGGSSGHGCGIDAYDLVASYCSPSDTLVSTYLTAGTNGSNVSGFSTNTGVTWDSSKNAARFDGSHYLQLERNPLSGASSSTGFAISMEVAIDDVIPATNTVNGTPVSIFKDSSNYILVNGDSGGDWQRGAFVYRNSSTGDGGGNVGGVWPKDFGDGNFDSGSSWIMNDSDDGKFHKITMAFDGVRMSYYVDGVLKAVTKDGYAVGGAITNATSILETATTCNIGVGPNTNGTRVDSNWNYNFGGFFKGYIRNLKFISNINSEAGQLALLMDKYEAKMESGTVYTKMAPAYKAYVDANEALDAYVYGNSNTAQIASAYTNLYTAINNMGNWSKYTGTATAYVHNNNGNSPVSADGSGTNTYVGYSNILYSSTAMSTKKFSKIGNIYPFIIMSSNTVLYYDGVYDSTNNIATNCYLPVLFAGHGTDSSNRDMKYVYNTSGALKLTRNWQGKQESSSEVGNSADSVTESNINSKMTVSWVKVLDNYVQGNNAQTPVYFGYTSSSSTTNSMGKKRLAYFGNKFYYTGTASTSISSISFALSNNGGDTTSGSVSTNIYVVNYYQLTSAIEKASNKAKYANVAGCKQGGMTTLLEDYDRCTSYDITKYKSGATLANAWGDGTETTITDDNVAYYYDYADKFTTFNAGVLDSSTATTDSEYVELRNAIDYSGVPTAFAGTDVAGVSYTVRDLYATNGYIYDTNNDGVINSSDRRLNLFDDFATAYTDAVAVMAALGTAGYNTNSTSNYTDSTAGAKATELVNAFNALNLVTLTAPTVNVNNGGGGVYIGKTNGFTLTNNDGQTPQYSVRYSTDGGSTWSAWSNYANYSAEVKPFGSLADTANKNNWAEVKTRSTDGNNHYSDESSATQVKFLSAPTLGSSSGSDELNASGTVSLTQTSDASGTLQYSYDDSTWHDYSTPIIPFSDNSTVSTITVYAREKKGTSYSPKTSATYNKSVLAPTFGVTDGAYLGKQSTVTISNNSGNTESGTVTIEYHYDSDGYTSYSSALTPFSGKNDGDGEASRTIHAKATRNGKTAESNITVHYLSRPTWSTDAALLENNELAAGETIELQATSGLSGGLQYSYDGGSSWHNYSTAIAPFTDNSTVSTITVSMRQISEYGSSPVLDVTFNKTVQPPVFSVANNIYLDKTHGVEILNNSANTESGTVTFTYKYDSGAEQDYNGELFPFSGKNDGDVGATVRISANAHRNGVTSNVSQIDVKYLSRPTVTFGGSALANNAIIGESGEITVENTSGATDGLKFSIDGSDNGIDITNGSAFSPFTLNTTATKLTVKVWQEKDGSKSPVYTVTIYKKPNNPTITSVSEFLDKTHGVSASLNDGTDDTASTLEISTDGSNFTPYTGTVYPFSGVTDENSRPQAKYYFRASRTIDGVPAHSEVVNTGTLYYLSQPRIMDTSGGADITANQVINETYRITISPQSGLLGNLKYSYDGTNWSDYNQSDKPAPFTDNPTKLSVTIYAKQVSGASESAVYSVKVVRDTAFFIYSATGDPVEYSDKNFTDNSKIYVSTTALSAGVINAYNGTDKYADTIFYKVTLDGVDDNTIYQYNPSTGIDVSLGTNGDTQPNFKTASVAKITVWLCEGGTTTVKDYVTQTLYNSDHYTDEVMQESFDGATISGTTLTMRGKTANTSDDRTATLCTSGIASIVDGAGWKDGNSNSPDWRNNVLKINANSTAPGNYIQFDSNPLAAPKAAAAANTYGVTISFWRYLERNGACADLDTNSEYDDTGYKWRNAIAFDDAWQNYQGYYFIEVNGVNSRCKTNYTDYYDYAQENQDPTEHAAGNSRGHWVNVVVTIDPAKGVTLYTNGEPHKMKAGYPKKVGDTFSGKSDAVIAQEILAFITNSGTRLLFNYGEQKEGNDYDMYLDDFRIYSGVKTQVEINNMYIDDKADVKSEFTSTSHDPTNVTVYTLAKQVEYTAYSENGGANNITLQKGTTVGQELIDYCGLDPIVGHGDVSAIDEYSFGTGMTIYHRNKTTKKWEVVGDDQGRCGYQNEKLFGQEYHDALGPTSDSNTPLGYAAGGYAGGGHLLWAPHVMFNLYNGKWTYYGSTSSWSSQRSAIFVCRAARGGSIEGPYENDIQIVYKSDGHPNAIDPCCYYAYENVGTAENPVYKPNTRNVYMAFGSWGGTSCIALKTLYADGDGNQWNTTFDGVNEGESSNKYLCNGINKDLEYTTDGDNGSGEGAYVIYDNGYYYLYISYGQNTGSYVERVYRSSSPTGGFTSYNGTGALDTETHATHGGQIIGGFDLSNHDYLMATTGHNSVYKTVNDHNEVVTVNSVHARPYANEWHGRKALPDGALATRQSHVTGNINLVNQIAYTKTGWPVLMPFQYDGTNTIEFAENEITGASIEGVYAANDLQNTVYYNYSEEYTYTIVKDDTDDLLAYEYGTDSSGGIFKDYIVLEKKALADGKFIFYARYYDAADFDIANKVPKAGKSPLYEGVIGKKGTQIGISMINTKDYEYTWTYRKSDIPKTEDVEPLGDSVSMDGVIYTHKVNDTYAKYGREISNDYLYGTSDQHQGERCTTITTTYPAKIDLTNPAAVYCLSDEQHCKTGLYAGGDFTADPSKDNKWYDASGNKYTDAEAIARGGVGTGGASDPLKRLYILKGYVSDYYFDATNGVYRDTGVKLVISYTDIRNSTKYSELEFCYVMANPAMAHTIQGIRNQRHGTGDYGDMRAGLILFDRFMGSFGQASSIGSSVVWNDYASKSNDEAEKHATGTYNYLDTFGSSASTSYDYSSPSKTGNSFTAFGSKEGVNSGSYGLIEHTNSSEVSYTVSSNVIDADYYIDYSNEENYDINNPYGLITTQAGAPTGYKFTFRTSNIKWDNTVDRRWNATSYMLLTGDLKNNVTTNSTYNQSRDSYVSQNCTNGEGRYTYGNYTSDEKTALGYTDDSFLISGIGGASSNTTYVNQLTNFSSNSYENKYTLGLTTETGRKVMSGYLTNPTAYIAGISGATSDNIRTKSDYYTVGLTRALPLIDTGNAATNAWNMHIDFVGSESVAKNTDTSSAEKYANFIIEQGIGVFSWGVNQHYANMEETYAYYNIGVHTCDKGAARAFADNYLRKKLAVTTNSDGSVTVKRNASTGAPIYLTAEGTETTDVTQAAILNPQNYTIKSYDEYIDAVAELAWFVEKPTNTTLGDYSDYTSELGSSTAEYTTAYTAGGAPIYNTTTAGNNILKSSSSAHTDAVQAKLINNVITAYENLFAESDYNNADEKYDKIELFGNGEATTVPENVDQIKITPATGESGSVEIYNKGDFTADSWLDFVQFIKDVAPAFAYRTDVGKKDPESWRRVELTGAEYRELLGILKDMDDSLLPAVDIAPLTATRSAKIGTNAAGDATGTLSGGIFTNTAKTVGGTAFNANDQVYTFSSWNVLNNKCIEAYTYLNSEDSHYARGQSATISAADIVNKGTSESDFNYTKGEYAVTGVTKHTFNNVNFYARTIDTSTRSDIQQTVDTENTDLAALSLTIVDAPACYDTYDGAKAVVDSLDMYKYTDHESENSAEWGGKQIIENASDTTNDIVYTVLDSAQASAYNALVTGASLAAELKLKNTTTGQTDVQSTALMTAINTVNNTHVDPTDDTSDYKYIKYFRISFTQQPADTEPGSSGLSTEYKKLYGDSVTVSIGDTSKIVNWSVSIYDGEYADGFGEKPRSSQKVSSVYGGSLTRIANNNMAIVAEVEQSTVPENKIQYNILDCYGNLRDVFYGSSYTIDGTSLSIDGKAVTVKPIPLYTLTGWRVEKKSDTLYTFKPLYDVGGNYTITVTDNGTETINNVPFDELVTLNVSDANEENFAAWAVKTESNKYQIASYSKSYSFYSVKNEDYVAIVNTAAEGEDPVYKTTESPAVTITADKIDGVITETGTISKDTFVRDKITNKYPFVSIQYANMYLPQDFTVSESTESRYTKARVYVRVTQGSKVSTTDDPTGLTSYGVLFRFDNADEDQLVINYSGEGTTYRRSVTNMLYTGQFTYTLNKTKDGFTDDVTFRAYVNYDFEYPAPSGEQGATINALDYSSILVASNTM